MELFDYTVMAISNSVKILNPILAL